MKALSKSTGHVTFTDSGTTWFKPALNASVTLTILGTLVSLKNRRRLLKNRRNGKMFSAKSEDAERYMADACAQIPPEYRNLRLGSLTSPVRLIATVYYPSRRSDLDVSLLLDCLQVSGVIRNDRDVIEMHLYSEVDTKSPRAELTIEQI